jgi:hypothetical protein
MRITVAIGLAMAMTVTEASLPPAQAQSAAAGMSRSNADVSSQNRPRPRVRIYRNDRRNGYVPDVYPRYNPGPNAVRDCTATYVQEFRPSGTVITPRMNCFWRPG